jgi:hypothetical protein
MNPIRLAYAIVAIASAELLVGCASFPVETDYDPATDFAALSSYAWLEATREKTGDPRLDNDLLDARVRRAVEAALSTKGYRKAEAGSTDFEITYHVGVERQVDVQTYVDSYPRGYRWHSGPTHAYTTVREYDVGSLVLDILDPSEKRLIWRGATQARINANGTPEEREQRARSAVDAILARFPPQ